MYIHILLYTCVPPNCTLYSKYRLKLEQLFQKGVYQDEEVEGEEEGEEEEVEEEEDMYQVRTEMIYFQILQIMLNTRFSVIQMCSFTITVHRCIIIAERLSARQLIVQRGGWLSACVCRYIYIYMYHSVLGVAPGGLGRIHL